MAKKASRKAKGQKTTASKRKRAGVRASGRKTAGARRKASARKTSRTSASTSRAKARGSKKTARKAARPAARRKAAPKRAAGSTRVGGSGRESTLAQTPETGRSVQGRTNPMPTKRSTGTAAGAGGTRHAPGLERERRRLREVEESVPGPPSSLNMDRHSSAARSGRATLRQAKREHTETSPAMTGGDVDADWEDAYAVGDEAPGGDNPTPDQDRVDDIGRALGIEYQDNEELKAADKIIERDRHRRELDPASAEHYKEHDQD
jgi:uncharacterized protein DUF6335